MGEGKGPNPCFCGADFLPGRDREAENRIVQLRGTLEGAECYGGVKQSVEDGELFFVGVGDGEKFSLNGMVGLMENGRFEQRLEG